MNLELRIVDLLARNAGKKYTINGISRSLEGHYSLVHRTVNRLAGDGVISIERAGKSHLCSIDLTNEKTLALIQLSEIERKNELYGSNKKLKVILEDFVESAEAAMNPASVVLFGSHASGRAAEESDIDILLISGTESGIDRITKEAYAKYGKEINAVVMNPAGFKKQKDTALIREIIKVHYVLYGAEKFVNLVFE